jgi:hypothetical protein
MREMFLSNSAVPDLLLAIQASDIVIADHGVKICRVKFVAHRVLNPVYQASFNLGGLAINAPDQFITKSFHEPVNQRACAGRAITGLPRL